MSHEAGNMPPRVGNTPHVPGSGPRVRLDLASFGAELLLPHGTDILRAHEPQPLADVPGAVARAFASPIGCPPLADICAQALKRMTAPERALPPSAVIVVSDDSRPVPYKGESGILWPLVKSLLDAGLPADWITLLVATGTHHTLAPAEVWALFDPRVREAGVKVSCHDAADPAALVPRASQGPVRRCRSIGCSRRPD